MIVFEWEKTKKGYWVRVIYNGIQHGFLSFTHKEFEDMFLKEKVTVTFKSHDNITNSVDC